MYYIIDALFFLFWAGTDVQTGHEYKGLGVYTEDSGAWNLYKYGIPDRMLITITIIHIPVFK